MSIFTTILVFIFVLFWLPGLVVYIQSLRITKKNGGNEVFWNAFSPITLLLSVVILLPAYSVALYSMFMVPAQQRPLSLKMALSKLRDGESSEENQAFKESIVFAIASILGIKIDED